jgi:diguanylate cyclase (GGDEF)-like protein
MRSGRCNHVREHRHAVLGWPVWQNPSWLVALIGVVVAGYLVAVATAAVAMPEPEPLRNLWLCALLLLCTAGTVELTRRAGENAGLIRDVYAVWELPLAILLPPVYALLAPVFRMALDQWRVRRFPLHRRVFSAAMVGLSYGAASLVFHDLVRPGSASVTSLLAVEPAAWVMAVAVAALVQWTVNTSLLLPAVKGSDPTARLRELVLAPERVRNDVSELCVAVLVTLGIAITPFSIVFAFPFVTLLQRSSRHAQLVNASRIDSKTGLLNAGTWEREASAEVSRAVRTRTSLAVAIIDIDHFKVINDTFGHLAGDKALRQVARTLTVFLRDYDLVGRFGGEEFVILLPQTKAGAAFRIAERTRVHIAAMPIVVHDDPAAEPVRLRISIGVAALGPRWDGNGQLTGLLAVADRALYQAKQNGRDQVCVITEDATLGPQEETTGNVPRPESAPAPASLPRSASVPPPASVPAPASVRVPPA